MIIRSCTVGDSQTDDVRRSRHSHKRNVKLASVCPRKLLVPRKNMYSCLRKINKNMLNGNLRKKHFPLKCRRVIWTTITNFQQKHGDTRAPEYDMKKSNTEIKRDKETHFFFRLPSQFVLQLFIFATRSGQQRYQTP